MIPRDDWKPAFGVLGSLAAASAVGLAIFIGVFRDTIMQSRGVDVGRSWPIAAWLLLSGVGFARCSRWGAVALSLPLAAVLAWWLGSVVVEHEWASAAMAVVMSPLFLGPAAVAFRRWRHLRTW